MLADTEHGAMLDVYHGRIWIEVLRYSGINFLVPSYRYALMLNVDWFQPFEHFYLLCRNDLSCPSKSSTSYPVQKKEYHSGWGNTRTL